MQPMTDYRTHVTPADRNPVWIPCNEEEHLLEVRHRLNAMASMADEIQDSRLFESVAILIAALQDLIDHHDGLHGDGTGDDVRVHLAEEPACGDC